MRRATTAIICLALAGAPQAVAAESAERPIDRAPRWFTADLARRAVRAGPAGVPLPQDARLPTSSFAFAGIRPGQPIVVTDSDELARIRSFALCTSNFVFTDGGSYWIGTAGHCGKTGDDVFMVFAPLGVVHIGRIVQSTFSEDRLAPDFALVSIAPALNIWVSPSMAHWGGPTGVYAGDRIEPVLHTGHGIGVGTGGTPRAGVAYAWGDEWRFEGAVVSGDSGSGAIVAGGLAAGNITHLGVDVREDVPVWMGGTSMVRIGQLVGNRRLATCPVAIPWPLPGCPPAL